MKKLLCMLLCLLLTGCAAAPAETEPELRGSLQVTFFTGGTLVTCNSETLLLGCAASLTPEMLTRQGVQSLSAVWLTETGEAQTGGLEALLEAFPAEVLTPEELPETSWLDCAQVVVHRVGEARAAELRFGETGLLLAAGLSTEEQELLADARIQADVLLLDAGTEPALPLLTAAAPEYTVIRGRSTEDTLTALAQADTEIFRTADFDTLGMESDGSTVTVRFSLHTSHPIAS